MPRRGKPTVVDNGIYRYDNRFRVIAKIRGQAPRETSFPLGTELRTMQRWQTDTKSELFKDAPSSETDPDAETLRAAVPRFVATLPEHSQKRKDYIILLERWLETPLADRRRTEIRQADILTQLAAWESAGVAISTRNHRLRAIRMLYDVLDADDEDAKNPAGKIKKTPEVTNDERGVPYALIERILAALPERRYERTLTAAAAKAIHAAMQAPERNASALARQYGVSETMVRKIGRREGFDDWESASQMRARLRVMAYTGLPPAQMMRLRTSDVDLVAKTVRVLPRRKGKGVKTRVLPLLEEAVDAFKDFIAANAWGTFWASSMQRSFDRAKVKVMKELRAELPAAEAEPICAALEIMRPYDLRHSFGTAAMARSSDLKGVKELMLHGDIRTTERYVGAAVTAVAERTRDALQASFPTRRMAPTDGPGEKSQ